MTATLHLAIISGILHTKSPNLDVPPRIMQGQRGTNHGSDSRSFPIRCRPFDGCRWSGPFGGSNAAKQYPGVLSCGACPVAWPGERLICGPGELSTDVLKPSLSSPLLPSPNPHLLPQLVENRPSNRNISFSPSDRSISSRYPAPWL